MQEIKFVKDHPSKRFKKGDIVPMPSGNVEAWVISGYAILNEVEDVVGNVPTSSENGGVDSKKNANKQSKFGKNKKKKRGNK